MRWVPSEVNYYPPTQNASTAVVEQADVWDSRKEEVKEAFKHAWKGYKAKAFPNDELLAVSGGSSNK